MVAPSPAMRIVIVGGGAAGFMAAITAAEAGADVTIYEALRQRMKKGYYSNPRFDKNALEKLKEEWLKK